MGYVDVWFQSRIRDRLLFLREPWPHGSSLPLRAFQPLPSTCTTLRWPLANSVDAAARSSPPHLRRRLHLRRRSSAPPLHLVRVAS